jgi:hypothetical protein
VEQLWTLIWMGWRGGELQRYPMLEHVADANEQRQEKLPRQQPLPKPTGSLRHSPHRHAQHWQEPQIANLRILQCCWSSLGWIVVETSPPSPVIGNWMEWVCFQTHPCHHVCYPHLDSFLDLATNMCQSWPHGRQNSDSTSVANLLDKECLYISNH